MVSWSDEDLSFGLVPTLGYSFLVEDISIIMEPLLSKYCAGAQPHFSIRV
jgi:hypothetical protein